MSARELVEKHFQKQYPETYQYELWIWEKWSDENGYAKCAERTLEMQKEFPELTRVRGHFLDWAWGPREHWWLVTPTGTIVDPTKDQFPSKGKGDYQPLDESLGEPTGRCLNCGELLYGPETFCSENCEIETRAEMGI